MQRLILSDLEETADSEAACCLAEVRRAVQACQRCIIITGAGISVSSGIPDFRSPDGLFQQLKQKYPSSVSSGRDLFDATLFHCPDMVGLFYNFMGELRNLVSQATCTPTHEFIKRLDENGKLLRCYTQNIDSLEKRIGLETSFQRTSKECCQTEPSKDSGGSRRRQTTLDKKFTRAVQLHGDLDNVVCTICHTKYPFTQQLAQEFCEGTPPACPRCKEIEAIRDIVGKRSVTAGVLRPDIVLYNEAHPQSELIGSLSEYDLKRRPDLLIVIGTSLKIPGIKRMIKEMSRCVHDSSDRTKRAGAGKAIYINRDEPPRGWDDVFDYYIAGDADQAISMLPIADGVCKTPGESTAKCTICPCKTHTKPSILKQPCTARPSRRQPVRSKPLALAKAKPSRKLTSMMKVVKSTLKPKAKPRQRSHRSEQQMPTSPLIY